MAAAVLLLLIVCTYFGAEQAAAATQQIKKIEAEYYGESLHVGEKIALRDIEVFATYMIYDGFTSYEDVEEIRSGFSINPSVIQKEGKNIITVTYQGKTDTITVEGKKLESISAEYLGDEVYVGSPINNAKVEVFAYYDDGSEKRVTNFKLSSTTVTKTGVNIFTVTYEGKTATIEVYGKEPLAVEYIEAEYTGEEPLFVGDTIPKGNIEVTLYYNDGTEKEVQTGFTISPSIIESVGENEVLVTYGGVQTEIYIEGIEKEVDHIDVDYIGYGVLIGEEVTKDQFKVTIVYEDGSEVVTKEFELYNTKIEWEDNMVFVSCAGETEAVPVAGVKGFAGNFDNPLSVYVSEESGTSVYTNVTLGMNMEVGQDKFAITAADAVMVDRMVRRVVTTSKYIGFQLTYDDDEMVKEFPMAMKVTVPTGYDTEKFAVYYTPNQSTVMAKVDGKFTDDTKTEYQFVAYETGVYILVNEEPQALVKEIIVDDKIKLKTGRNFTLKPQVFPASAENKKLTFWSSDESIATISENGNIKALKAGVCTILIHASDNGGAFRLVTLIVE